MFFLVPYLLTGGPVHIRLRSFTHALERITGIGGEAGDFREDGVVGSVDG
jgi:hypothetical protein